MNLSARAAIWVLERSGVAAENEPATGDLLEEHAYGRSSAWLWRQTLALVLATAIRDLRAHKLLALRAVLTGLAVIFTLIFVRPLVTSHPWASGRVGFWLVTFAGLMLAGWVIGVTHRSHKAAMLFAFAAYAVFAKGWVYTTHFPSYWDLSRASTPFVVEVGLTALGICLSFVGGLLADTRACERTAMRLRNSLLGAPSLVPEPHSTLQPAERHRNVRPPG